MFLLERNTDNRGRSLPVDLSALRTRLRRSSRGLSFEAITDLLLLALLAEDALVCIFDTLALVRLGTAELADFGGHLADLLLVDPAHDDLGRLGRLDRDAFGDR